jgi:DNA-binding phage protein
MNKECVEEFGFVLKEDTNLQEYDPVKNLLDVNKMGAAIMQCLIENDTEGVLEIIENYLYALNKTQFLKTANIPRSTVYIFFRRRNPTIKTLAKIMSAFVHSSAHN